MENRIRKLREEFHMTQVRLGIELGVAQETISAYESQRHYPSFTQMLKMSEIFHASIDYIMGLSEVRRFVLPPRDENLTKLTELGRRLNQRQLELALAYVQGLVDASTDCGHQQNS